MTEDMAATRVYCEMVLHRQVSTELFEGTEVSLDPNHRTNESHS
jgi:hypothetical protein